MAHGDYNLSLTGKNFAPIDGLKDVKATARNNAKNPSSVNAFFREIYQGLSRENEQGWREIIEQARVISLLTSGKLTMKGDIAHGGYVFFKPLASSVDRSNYPLFPQNYEILSSKWTKISPQMAARQFGDGYKTELQLSGVNTMVKSYFRDIFKTEYKTREAHSALDYGTFITQFEYDDQLNQMMQIVPVIQNQSKVLVDGYGACYDCGKEGHPNDFARDGAAYPQCPECDSFRTTKMVPDAVADASAITDIETITQGDICGRLRDFAACRYDARVFAHESDWFLYSERVPLRMIRKLFGADIDIEAGDAEDMGFQIMDALAVRGGATEGNGDNTLFGTHDRFTEEGTLRHMWLKPAQYAGFKLEKSERTMAGTIPANVPFEEIFPEGVCVRGYNNMQIQIGLFAEKANLASQVYLYQSHSGHGKGVDSAVDASKDLNEVYSMAMAELKRKGAGGLAVDKDAGLTSQDVKNLFKPQKVVFFDTTNNGGDINKVVQQIQTNPVNPVLPQMMIQLANMVNLSFMTSDYSQGSVQDVDINTFGGQQLATAKAEEQKAGIWGRLTSHRVQSAEIICDLARKHNKIPRYYAHGEDNHGTIRGKLISADDLPENIKFDAVADTEIPQNRFEKNLAKDAMIEKAGGIAQFAQVNMQDPKLIAWYAQGRGLDLPGIDKDEVHIVTLGRLAEVQELANIYPDPNQILAALTCKLRVREDGHVDKALFLQQILDDDEIQTWNPVAIATIEQWIETHYQLEAEAQYRNETIKQQVANTLAGQQATANAAIMQPQVDQAKADEQNQQLAGAAQEVGGRILDDEQAEVDHERSEEAKDNDEERSERAADKQHARSLELEKAKAKLKPAPAKSQAARGK